MKTKIVILKKNHLSEVYNLLMKNISKFKPLKKNYFRIWSNLSRQKNSYCFVLIKLNKVIGFGSIFFFLKVRGNMQGVIEDIVVDKKYRGLGLGKALLLRLFKKAKKQKCYKIILQSNKKQLIFYKKNGFKVHNISMQKIL